MYSRYIPGPDGVYQRKNMERAPAAQDLRAPPSPPVPTPGAITASRSPAGLKQRLSARLPGKMELGDVLVLLIALLLLIDAEEDLQPILITAAAFFFL